MKRARALKKAKAEQELGRQKDRDIDRSGSRKSVLKAYSFPTTSTLTSSNPSPELQFQVFIGATFSQPQGLHLVSRQDRDS